MSLTAYLAQLNQAINREDGKQLCSLFALNGPGLEYAMQLSYRSAAVPTAEVNRQMGAWSGIVMGYLQAMVHASRGDKLHACQEFREKHARGLLGLISEQPWVLPAVIGTASTLRVLSAKVDDDLLRRGGTITNSQLAQCAMMLQSIFAKTAAAKGQDADQRKAAAVAIGCIMFKVYFRLNTLTNCKNVVKTIDDTLKIFDTAQLCHKVTFRYYTGRLLAYDEDFIKADEHLSYALRNCHRDAHANKRRILRYLIPVKMLLGVLPTDALLKQYKLTEYSDIAQGLRHGNVALLLKSLEVHQVLLVQAGTYLLIEKLQLAAYRRLFKKVALVHAAINPSKASQVHLGLFSAALELQGITKDEIELQCLVANLIYRKYIKGYIALKQKVLVLAKTDAFPPLSTVQLGDPFG